MSVKRYELELYHCNGGEMLVSETGDYVSHDDYAALEQRLIESERYGRQTDITIDNLEMKLAQMAAENAGLKKFCKDAAFDADYEAELGMERGGFTDALNDIKTPATDAFLAEVRAQARNEGINYAAGRLAAAFNHGFVDKPLAEVYDVVRMILTTKEDLANDSSPATDGLSGEYAEAFLEDSVDEIRKGVQS